MSRPVAEPAVGGFCLLLARRFVEMLLIVWLVSGATFVVMLAAPGEPTILASGSRVPPSQQQGLQRALGLDQPAYRQYLKWLAASVRGDWGVSLNHGRPVAELLAHHLPPTLLLGSAALAVAVVIGMAIGAASASRPGSTLDLAVRSTSLLVYSLPTFWIGLMAIFVFSYWIPLFPPGHMGSAVVAHRAPLRQIFDLLHHLSLPALVLGASMAPGIARLLRASLLDNLGRSFIVAARARGLSSRRIILHHALPLSLAPVIQVIGLSLPMLAGGVLVTEVVFSWPA